MQHVDCIIIGSGPAGLMAANVLQKHRKSFVVLERNSSAGKKLLITGNGRCNVTNRFQNKDFIEELQIKNKRFLYSSIQSFGTEEVKRFFEQKGVPLLLEGDIKYFPKSSKSNDILDALLLDVKAHIVYNATVQSILHNEDFILQSTKGKFTAKNVIVATGSASFPKTGSDGSFVKIIEKLGHNIVPFYPAETNVYSGYISSYREYLQGIAIKDCEVKVEGLKQRFKGDLLFTHFGLSGPVIQSASEFIYHQMQNNHKKIMISFTPLKEEQLLSLLATHEGHYVLKVLEKILIKRCAKFIVKQLKLEQKKIVELGPKGKRKLIQNLKEFPVKIDRVESKENAYVNGGGVMTKEINPTSMQSKLIKGLFFAGEVMDVHGPIGGFNITIALSTGHAAASYIVHNK